MISPIIPGGLKRSAACLPADSPSPLDQARHRSGLQAPAMNDLQQTLGKRARYPRWLDAQAA